MNNLKSPHHFRRNKLTNDKFFIIFNKYDFVFLVVDTLVFDQETSSSNTCPVRFFGVRELIYKIINCIRKFFRSCRQPL
jgi:hypothetical protein